MPASAIIGAAGSVAGGIASGKGASSAAKIQAQAQAQQTAAIQSMYNNNVALAKPTMDNGTAAQNQIQSLLGLGGDSTSALATLQATPGYQYQLQQGLAATQAAGAAAGMSQSGAELKSLQDRGNGLAQQNYNNYVAQLGTVADRGVNAENAIAGQGNTSTAALNATTQTGANAASAASAYSGTNIANMLKGLTTSATQAFGSSYTPTSTATASTPTFVDPTLNYNTTSVGW